MAAFIHQGDKKFDRTQGLKCTQMMDPTSMGDAHADNTVFTQTCIIAYMHKKADE
jgi:hypothetical protein